LPFPPDETPEQPQIWPAIHPFNPSSASARKRLVCRPYTGSEIAGGRGGGRGEGKTRTNYHIWMGRRRKRRKMQGGEMRMAGKK